MDKKMGTRWDSCSLITVQLPTPHCIDMQGWVDSLGARQLESNRCRVDNLFNNKRPDELGGQLIGLHPQWKVLG